MKGKYLLSIDSEDLSRNTCKGKINIKDNKLKKVIDIIDFIIPKNLLQGLKATFDQRTTNRKLSFNLRVKF